jgi:hypothetical protein
LQAIATPQFAKPVTANCASTAAGKHQKIQTGRIPVLGFDISAAQLPNHGASGEFSLN